MLRHLPESQLDNDKVKKVVYLKIGHSEKGKYSTRDSDRTEKRLKANQFENDLRLCHDKHKIKRLPMGSELVSDKHFKV